MKGLNAHIVLLSLHNDVLLLLLSYKI